MAQFTTTEEIALADPYLQCDLNPSKRPDFIVAIAGWPTLYSCVTTYTVPATGDLSTANGFSTGAMFAWAKFPEIGATAVKGAFPEEGEFSNGKCNVEIVDKHGVSTSTRDLTELVSRQAFLEGNRTGTETTLATALTKGGTTVVLTDGSGFVEDDIIWIGQEAIQLGNKSTNTFTGCTRAYLLTDATPHESAVKAYGYMPSLVGRRFWIFKGYQDLALTDWLKGWGGIITETGRTEPGLVRIGGFGTTWEMWGGSAQGASLKPKHLGLGVKGKASVPQGVRKIVRLGQINDDLNEEMVSLQSLTTSLGGDYGTVDTYPIAFGTSLGTPTGLGDGHFTLRLGVYWLGIYGISEYTGSDSPLGGLSDSTSVIFAGLVKGLGSGSYPDAIEVGQSFDLGWSNVHFSLTAAPTGSDPIDLLLRLATSTGESADEVTPGSNGAYDLFKKGIGLAINVEKFDLDTFTDIQDQYEYDGLSKVFFLFSEPTPAKPFFDDELCKPFGWYLAAGNDGRIRLVRPRNPLKLYFSRANNGFVLTHSSSPWTKAFYLPGGVYTPSEAATALTAGLSAATGQAFTVTWSSSTGKFTVEVASGSFTFSAVSSWATLGHAAVNAVATTASEPRTVVGIFVSTDFNTVTENDVIAGSISQSENASTRIGRIAFGCNYNWNEDKYEYQLFSDAEIENLSGYGEANAYEVNSKGLLRAFDSSGKRKGGPWRVLLPPANGCTGTPADPSSSVGIDSSDSGTTLFCEHLFDRYRNAPIRFKCKLKWKFNTREVGDNLLWNYAPKGVFLDGENAADVLTGRVFEIVSTKPVPKQGYVEVECLGHRNGG